jgi:hypothetical protein
MRRPRSLPAPALLLILLSVISSCGPGPYDRALSTWTRSAKVYRDLESRITVSATYLSPGFVEAMTAERVRVFAPTEAALAAWRKERSDEAAQSEVFFVSVETRDRDWNDLDRADSMWRLYLETDRGVKVPPARVVAVRGQPPVLSHFFPHLGHFAIGYWVYFPRYPEYRDGEGLPRPVVDASLSWFKLRMRSPVAAVELTWKPGD